MDNLPAICVINSTICKGPQSKCPASSLTQLENMTVCSLCSVGLVSNSSIFGCMNCPPNFFISQGSCLTCPTNSYSVHENSFSCIACGETSVAKSFSCVCRENFYGLPNSNCSKCLLMPGVICPENSTIPFVLSGYGRSSQDISLAVACIPAEACVWTNYSEETYCASGYQGAFCSKCADDYYRSGTVCVPCGVEVLKFVALVLILFLLVAALLRLSSYVNRVPSDVRITLAAMQVIALFPTISHSWPKSLSTFMEISSFANINIGFSSPECAVKTSFWTSFHIKMLLPLIIIMLVGILNLMINLVKNIRPLLQVERLVQIALFIMMISYTMQVVTLVQPLNCFQRGDGYYYLYSDQSVRCLDQEWNRNVGFSALYFIIFLGIFPGVISTILYMNRHDLENPKFNKLFGQLVQPYRKKFFYWEAVVMMRKIFLALTFQVFGSFLSKTGQLFFIIIVLFGFLFLEVVKLPSATHHDNVLNVVWMIICILLLLSNGLIFSQDDIPESQKVTGGVIMLLVVLIAIFVCIGTAIKKVLDSSQAWKASSLTTLTVTSMPETAPSSGETDEVAMLARTLGSTVGERTVMGSFSLASPRPVGLTEVGSI
eukprot:TRINITY_DN401_c1_g1_i5.p1 TRINITY_DN401_c1_g1~~TRINITY_DN401_c1_g1_i5.p1  ORF type:complete len:691 (+),score=123.41 TRINITY_DN401_c1_g1_i5:269-2074(+)